LADFNMT